MAGRPAGDTRPQRAHPAHGRGARFNPGRHSATALSWADGDAARTDADGGVIAPTIIVPVAVAAELNVYSLGFGRSDDRRGRIASLLRKFSAAIGLPQRPVAYLQCRAGEWPRSPAVCRPGPSGVPGHGFEPGHVARLCNRWHTIMVTSPRRTSVKAGVTPR
jgi:hypothetical protein